MLSTEQLMQKRRKCVALWPWAKESEMLGKIELDPQGKSGWEWWKEIGKHPHLFKELSWWEERDEKDMPRYIKNIVFPEKYVIKIEGHFNGIFHSDQGLYPFINDTERFVFQGKYHFEDSYYRDFIPATESEYNAYINQ